MTEPPSNDRQRWEERYAERSRDLRPPSPFLVAHAQRLCGRVLDVAGGSGRNALYLARRGSTVDIIDIAAAGLRLALDVARAEGLSLRAVQADLESFPLPRARFDAVMNFRYLQRSLFASLQKAVKPGGVILFESFLIDQQQIGHPRNPQFLLQRGELRAAFEHCEMIEYWEGRSDDEEPAYVARMLARRPLESRD